MSRPFRLLLRFREGPSVPEECPSASPPGDPSPLPSLVFGRLLRLPRFLLSTGSIFGLRMEESCSCAISELSICVIILLLEGKGCAERMEVIVSGRILLLKVAEVIWRGARQTSTCDAVEVHIYYNSSCQKFHFTVTSLHSQADLPARWNRIPLCNATYRSVGLTGCSSRQTQNVESPSKVLALCNSAGQLTRASLWHAGRTLLALLGAGTGSCWRCSAGRDVEDRRVAPRCCYERRRCCKCGEEVC